MNRENFVNRPEQITIVGAGLVGSMLGVLLGNRGYQVSVFEKRSDMRNQEVDGGRSINLALAQRGIAALEEAQLMHDARKLLIPMKGRMLHDQEGNLEFFPYGQRDEEIIYSISRQKLNEMLLSAAETSCQVQLNFEHQLESINFEKQSIHFLDLDSGLSKSIDYQILIGADGAGSRVRRALLSAVDGNDQSELLDHDYKELTISPSEQGHHQIEKEALHIWPRGGFMLIALPNLDGSFTVTLFLQKKGRPSFEQLTNAESVEAFFREHFPDALKLIPNLSDEFFENPQGILGTVRCSPWLLNSTAMLIGDASHAIVPFHGQGMNAGFEDCHLFVELLENCGHNWPQAMLEFDRTRKDDADAIADMALENYITMRDSVRDPKFQLKKELGFELEKRHPKRFVPRYSLVMFHQIPYSSAKSRGLIQDKLLNELLENCDELSDVNFELADEMVTQKLSVLQSGLVRAE